MTNERSYLRSKRILGGGTRSNARTLGGLILGQKNTEWGLIETGLLEVVLSKKRMERVAALSQASIQSVLRGSDSYYVIDLVQKTGVGCEIG